MTFFALVTDDSGFAVELYVTLEAGEEAVATVLREAPEYEGLVRLEQVDLSGKDQELELN